MKTLVECPDFSLPGVDGNSYTLRNFEDTHVLVVLFLSNTCPYVDALEERILSLSHKYSPYNVAFLAICSNSNPSISSGNSFEDIRQRWQNKGYKFPYLYDQRQNAARSFGAICTPDIFVFDQQKILRYHGRFDDNWQDPYAVRNKYVEEAIIAILNNEDVTVDQPASIGCVIKWNESDAIPISPAEYIISPHLRILKHPSKILLINPMNGVLIEANEDLVSLIMMFTTPKSIDDVISCIEAPDDIFEIFSELISSKYLIEINENENLPLIERVDQRRRRVRCGSLLSILRLNLANNCNFRCAYCYMEAESVNRAKKDNGTLMSLAVARKSVDVFLDNALRNGRRNITIRYIGGEPLLNKDVLLRTISYAEELCKAKGIGVTHLLCTNGVLIDTDIISAFKALQDGHVLVSLDGVQSDNDKIRYYIDGSGTYNDIVKSIKLLIDNGVNVGVPTVISQTNINRLDEFLTKMKSIGITRVGLNPEYNFGHNAFDSKTLPVLVSKLINYRNVGFEEGMELNGKAYLTEQNVIYNHLAYCEGMGRALVVDPDGTLSCCDKFADKIGTIDNLDDFLGSQTYEKFAMRVRGNIIACNDCEIKWFCNGGCAAEINSTNGDILERSINCDFIKAMFEMTFQKIDYKYS